MNLEPDAVFRNAISNGKLLQSRRQQGTAHQALRVGTWKYIPGQAGSAPAAATLRMAALYDLATDLAEAHNLAGQQPGQVQECQALLDRIKTTGASRP